MSSWLPVFESKQIQAHGAPPNRPCLWSSASCGDSETNLDDASCNFFLCLFDCVFEALLTAKISLSELFNVQTVFKIGLNIIYSMRCFQGAICQDFSIQWTSRHAYLHLHSDWKPVFLKEHQYIPSKCVANCAHFNLYSCGWGLCSVILSHQIPCDTPSASRLFCISFCIFATYDLLLQPLLFLTTSQYFQLKL